MPLRCRVKYVVAVVALISAGLLLAMVLSGHRTVGDFAILAVAIGAVCLCGSLPVLLGVRRKSKKPIDRIVVKDK